MDVGQNLEHQHISKPWLLDLFHRPETGSPFCSCSWVCSRVQPTSCSFRPTKAGVNIKTAPEEVDPRNQVNTCRLSRLDQALFSSVWEGTTQMNRENGVFKKQSKSLVEAIEVANRVNIHTQTSCIGSIFFSCIKIASEQKTSKELPNCLVPNRSLNLTFTIPNPRVSPHHAETCLWAPTFARQGPVATGRDRPT